MKRLMIVMASVLAFASAVEAKTKRHSWTAGVCEYTVRFDPAKTPEQKLKDTVFLVYQSAERGILSVPMPSKPAEALAISLDEVEKSCAERRERLVALDPLALGGSAKGVLALREALVAEADDECAFTRAKVKGYSDPEALRAYEPAKSCNNIVDALSDPAKLEPFWRAFTEDLCKDNLSVEDCRKRELDKAALPDAADWMKLTLIEFGWNNCANAFTLRGSSDFDAAREKQVAAFKKVFKPRETCEEP
jgi:hypothetical protein